MKREGERELWAQDHTRLKWWSCILTQIHGSANLSLHQNPLSGLFKHSLLGPAPRVSDLAEPEWGPRTCISDQSPSTSDAAGPVIRLWEPHTTPKPPFLRSTIWKKNYFIFNAPWVWTTVLWLWPFFGSTFYLGDFPTRKAGSVSNCLQFLHCHLWSPCKSQAQEADLTQKTERKNRNYFRINKCSYNFSSWQVVVTMSLWKSLGNLNSTVNGSEEASVREVALAT